MTIPDGGTLARYGYEFGGWMFKGTVYQEDDSVSFAKNARLKPHWVPLEFTLDYDGNDNTGGTVPDDQEYTFGVKTKNPLAVSDLTKDYFTFNGWHTNADGAKKNPDDTKGRRYKAGKKAVIKIEDATLYSHWKPVKYTITYNKNKAKGSVPKSQKVVAGESATYTIQAPSLTVGYNFLGWSNQKGSSVITHRPGDIIRVTAKGTLKLFAVFEVAPKVNVRVLYEKSFYSILGSSDSKAKKEIGSIFGNAKKPFLARWNYDLMPHTEKSNKTFTVYDCKVGYTDNCNPTICKRSNHQFCTSTCYEHCSYIFFDEVKDKHPIGNFGLQTMIHGFWGCAAGLGDINGVYSITWLV